MLNVRVDVFVVRGFIFGFALLLLLSAVILGVVGIIEYAW